MSRIEWTGDTWNPIVGCSPASAGCDNCYAQGQVHRFDLYGRPTTIKLGASKRPGLTFTPMNPATGKTLGRGGTWTGAVWLLPDVLDKPLKRRKPTTYFVNSLSDMFHESIVGCEIGRRFLAAMFGVMAATPQHTYQILTKRPDQAQLWFQWIAKESSAWAVAAKSRMAIGMTIDDSICRVEGMPARVHATCTGTFRQWPLRNVWIGASTENQAWVERRIPELLRVPAAVRFLSCEPLLGPLDLVTIPAPDWLDGEGGSYYHALLGFPYFRNGEPSGGSGEKIDWVIVGGESGPKARPCDIAWIRSIVEQCKAAEVPVFVKQLGKHPVAHDGIELRLDSHHGGDMAEWPEALRVREMPDL
jgi:protein gp37